MTIFLDKRRKIFGVDINFDDFISLLETSKIILNFKNNKIIEALKECFKYYCLTGGKINKQTLVKDVIKRIPFIKHHHSSHEGLLERGFDEYFIEKYKKEHSCICVEFWIKRGHSEAEAKKIISELQSKRGKKNKGKTVIVNKKYIESLGINPEKFFKERSIWCVDYWIKRGYSEEEAKSRISKHQKEMSLRSASRSKEDIRKSSNKCVEYWIERGYSEAEAKKIISESQKTFSLEKCIKENGEIEGYKIWKNRQIKWQDSLNKTGFHQLGHSPISQELFKEIEKHYSKDDRDFIFYETKNREYTLKNNNGFYYRYDFCDLNKRKLIEFNGDIYHGNPEIYLPEDKPNPFHDKTARELWDIDEDKKKIAEKNGFEELIIWEKDYRENKNKIINECIKFLNL